jgi:hypothetical protein
LIEKETKKREKEKLFLLTNFYVIFGAEMAIQPKRPNNSYLANYKAAGMLARSVRLDAIANSASVN